MRSWNRNDLQPKVNQRENENWVLLLRDWNSVVTRLSCCYTTMHLHTAFIILGWGDHFYVGAQTASLSSTPFPFTLKFWFYSISTFLKHNHIHRAGLINKLYQSPNTENNHQFHCDFSTTGKHGWRKMKQKLSLTPYLLHRWNQCLTGEFTEHESSMIPKKCVCTKHYPFTQKVVGEGIQIGSTSKHWIQPEKVPSIWCWIKWYRNIINAAS